MPNLHFLQITHNKDIPGPRIIDRICNESDIVPVKKELKPTDENKQEKTGNEWSHLKDQAIIALKKELKNQFDQLTKDDVVCLLMDFNFGYSGDNVSSALEINAFLNDYNESRRQKGQDPINFKIIVTGHGGTGYTGQFPAEMKNLTAMDQAGAMAAFPHVRESGNVFKTLRAFLTGAGFAIKEPKPGQKRKRVEGEPLEDKDKPTQADNNQGIQKKTSSETESSKAEDQEPATKRQKV